MPSADRASLLAALLSSTLAALGCGASRTNGFDAAEAPPDGGSDGTAPGVTVFDDDGGACTGLCRKKVRCSSGGTTTVTGRVFDPAGRNPLANVGVYVPSELPLPPLPSGVSCDRCGAAALKPAASALTDEQGLFTLSDVPVDANLPVVVQIGKWRRTFTLPTVTACAENTMPSPLTLPKNGREGDMPQMAVAVAGSDAFECLLYGMGIDRSEFTGAGGSGHVRMYPPVQNADLWNDVYPLSLNDIVLLDCEGQEVTDNKGAASMKAMHDYASAGGRIFATHYHSVWFKGSSPGLVPAAVAPSDFAGAASWKPEGAIGASGSGTYAVDQSFPKGMSFAKWLVNVGASPKLGEIPLTNIADSVLRVNSPPSTQWISGAGHVQYMSFNAPTTAATDSQCGRVVFSDLHVSGSGVMSFPSDCKFAPDGGLTPQQKAMEFMFFDLASCVQPDAMPPTPPK